MDNSILTSASPYQKPIIKRRAIRIQSSIPFTVEENVNHKHPTLDPIPKSRSKRKSIKEKIRKSLEVTKNLAKPVPNPIKNNYLLNKLTSLLSKPPEGKSPLNIYSEIFEEFAESFPEFKDLLTLLKKGLILSANKESFENLEYFVRDKAENTEIVLLYEKEKRGNLIMTAKLNRMNDENNELRRKYEDLYRKYEVYEKVVHNNADKFIEAENLVEKMMSQLDVIQKLQDYIARLEIKEKAFFRLLEIAKEKGIQIEDIEGLHKDTGNPVFSNLKKRSNTTSGKTNQD